MARTLSLHGIFLYDPISHCISAPNKIIQLAPHPIAAPPKVPAATRPYTVTPATAANPPTGLQRATIPTAPRPPNPAPPIVLVAVFTTAQSCVAWAAFFLSFIRRRQLSKFGRESLRVAELYEGGEESVSQGFVALLNAPNVLFLFCVIFSALNSAFVFSSSFAWRSRSISLSSSRCVSCAKLAQISIR